MSFARHVAPRATVRRAMRFLSLGSAVVVLSVAGVSCSSSTIVPPPPPVVVSSITITGGNLQLEKGYHHTLTAVARNSSGVVLSVPFAWRSLDEKVVTVDVNGQLSAIDTGVATVYTSSLGVNSNVIGVHVVWQGAAKIAAYQFTPPGAVSPGATPDSIRVQVLNNRGLAPVVPVRVAFAVTAGGGTVSPAIATTNQLGIASAAWTLGSALGTNTVSATALGENDKPFSFVSPNTATFSITTFSSLVVADGDKQTGLILSALPVNPSVKVLDSAGKPRLGVPVTFTPTAGGRVLATTVSTGADGSASPGAWTLGDIPGDQTLIATVEFATITLHATATGSAIHFSPLQVIAGGFATCAINIDTSVSCWGEQPKVGDSTLINRFRPTAVRSTKKFGMVAASMFSASHFCGVSIDQKLYCWGLDAYADTNTKNTVFNALVPTRINADTTLAFTQVAAGGLHNCALATDQKIYCWGDNQVGQLADLTIKTHLAPAVISGGFKWSAVTSGSGATCGLAIDGSAYCWGLNANGQLGDGTTVNRVSPTAVSGALTFQQISAGESFACGLTTAGRPYCWGNLGVGSLIVTSPRTYAAAPSFTSISSGGGHVCALTADGTPYCWGSNGAGQLGDSTQVSRQTPAPVATALKFKAISAGYFHTCGSAIDGSVACWGSNSVGELADSASIGTIRRQPRYVVLGVNP